MTHESSFSPLAAASELSDTPWRAAMRAQRVAGRDAIAAAARGRRRRGRAGGGGHRVDRRGRRLSGRGDGQVRAGDHARLGGEAVGRRHRARRQVVGVGDAPERLAGGNGVCGRHGRRGHQGARGHRGQQGTEHGALTTTVPAVPTRAARCSVNLQAAVHLRFSAPMTAAQAKLWLQKWRWYERNTLPVEPRAHPLGDGQARGVRALAGARQRARGAARGAPGGGRRDAVRARGVDHRAGRRPRAHRRGDAS